MGEISGAQLVKDSRNGHHGSGRKRRPYSGKVSHKLNHANHHWRRALIIKLYACSAFSPPRNSNE